MPLAEEAPTTLELSPDEAVTPLEAPTALHKDGGRLGLLRDAWHMCTHANSMHAVQMVQWHVALSWSFVCYINACK